MTEQQLLLALLPYLNHKHNCAALGAVWDKGPCDCGFEPLMEGIYKRHAQIHNQINRIAGELELNGFSPMDLDDDLHDVAAEEASSVNNAGLGEQVAFLLARGALPSVLGKNCVHGEPLTETCADCVTTKGGDGD